jgi:glutathione synthase/RimK-type ligase-like ATP-grasp enzyme
MERARLGLVTTVELGIVDDDRPLADALARRGVDAIAVPWDAAPDDHAAATAPRALLMRSAWTSHLAPARFLAWLAAQEAGGARIVNAPALVRWNLRKTYLRELAAAGATLPPTVWLEAGARASLATVLADAGLDQAVVKPVVSASAYRTIRVGAGASAAVAAAHQVVLDEILADGGAMVQGFVPEVERAGELSLIVIGGAFTHAVCKRPAPGDFRVQSDFGGSRASIDPPASLIALAEALVARLAPAPLYARVDLVVTPAGPVLMELEAIDPELFLRRAPAAAERLAELLVPIVNAAT